jgi:exosortase H (IPTLxxWG-CTERM-specific)
MSGKKRQSQKDSEKDSKPRASIKRFILTYLLLMGLFCLLIGLRPIQNLIDLNGLYSKSVVFLTGKVLDFFGIPSICRGSIIQLPSIALDVKFGCSGLEAVMIYCIAVIAFPSPWKGRLIGIVFGFLVIQALNIVRIAGLAYAGIHFKNLFDYIHIYVAQGIMIAVSLAIFFIYLSYAKIADKTVS